MLSNMCKAGEMVRVRVGTRAPDFELFALDYPASQRKGKIMAWLVQGK